MNVFAVLLALSLYTNNKCMCMLRRGLNIVFHVLPNPFFHVLSRTIYV